MIVILTAKGEHINQGPGRVKKKSEWFLWSGRIVTATAEGMLTVMLQDINQQSLTEIKKFTLGQIMLLVSAVIFRMFSSGGHRVSCS